MTPPVQPRPSASIAFRVAEAVGNTLLNLVVGAALFVPGLLWFLNELGDAKTCGAKIHTAHISTAVGLMVAGAIVVRPPFGKQLTSIFVTVFPNGLPLLGGRRTGDPQPSESEDTPK